MTGTPGSIGEGWADAHDVPAPTAEDMVRARQSTLARREVDEQYARWLGLPEDEVAPFLERLRVFDARTVAFEERVANDALEVERRRGRYFPVDAPRLDPPPRIYAPRAA